MILADVFWMFMHSFHETVFVTDLSSKLDLLSLELLSLVMRWCVADMSKSLLILSAFISLEICLHLLSLHAPTSDPVVPHWERQATGSSQTRRRAELPNHIPSLPTTVSISLLSSQPPPPPHPMLETGLRRAEVMNQLVSAWNSWFSSGVALATYQGCPQLLAVCVFDF